MTWRASEALMERVRRTAAEQGRSMNDFVTVVLEAATDPGLAGDEAAQLRARFAAAGILAPAGAPRTKPSRAALAKARKAATGGTALSALVREGRG